MWPQNSLPSLFLLRDRSDGPPSSYRPPHCSSVNSNLIASIDSFIALSDSEAPFFSCFLLSAFIHFPLRLHFQFLSGILTQCLGMQSGDDWITSYIFMPLTCEFNSRSCASFYVRDWSQLYTIPVLINYDTGPLAHGLNIIWVSRHSVCIHQILTNHLKQNFLKPSITWLLFLKKKIK